MNSQVKIFDEALKKDRIEFVIKKFSKHAVQQSITRGFKPNDIIKIIRVGKATQAMGRRGLQNRYILGNNTVVVNAQGEVITVFSNAEGSVKGLRRGYIDKLN